MALHLIDWFDVAVADHGIAAVLEDAAVERSVVVVGDDDGNAGS